MPRPSTLRLLSAALLMCAAPALADAVPPVSPRRGINTAPWIYRARTAGNDGVTFLYDDLFPNLKVYTGDDFRMLHEAGADFVRVPVEASPFLVATPAQRAKLVQTVLNQVRKATQQGMTAVIDLCPRNSVPAWTGIVILSSPQLSAAYKATLLQFARALNANGTPNVVLELMNEPPGGFGWSDPYSWLQTQIDLVRSIRAVAPTLTLLLSGDQNGGIDGLLRVDPTLFDNPRTLYSFHYYDPMIVSSQGTPSTFAPARQYYAGVPYPPAPQAAPQTLRTVHDAIAAAVPDPAAQANLWGEAQSDVTSYYQGGKGRSTIKAAFARVSAWAATYRIPPARVILGEFGVARPGASHLTDVNYTRDVRQSAEDAGFGWAYFNYAPIPDAGANFSILRMQDPDPTALDAGIIERGLGWTMPQP